MRNFVLKVEGCDTLLKCQAADINDLKQQISGKKKALQLDPVEFETMKPNFCVDCQFFRAVENSTNLFKCHGVDTESVEAAEILAIVDMQFQKETGYWKLSPESLEVLEDAKERASS